METGKSIPRFFQFALSSVVLFTLNSCIRGEDYIWNVDQYCMHISESPPIMNVLWGVNEFIAVDTCKVYKSSDGKNWGETDLPGFKPEKVVWGNGQYIGFAQEEFPYTDNKIAISADGINWIETALIPNNGFGLLDITWGNNEYIAVGDRGQVEASVDATAWSSIATNILEPIGMIGYVNGNYLSLVGSRSKYHDELYKTINARDWFIVNLPYDDYESVRDKMAFAANPEGIVIAGDPTSFFSADGENWQKIDPPLAMHQVTSCTGSNKFFGAKSGGGWFDAPKVYFSDDGINWEEHWIANWGYVAEKYFDVYSVACNENAYVVAGNCTDNKFLGWADYYSCLMYSP